MESKIAEIIHNTLTDSCSYKECILLETLGGDMHKMCSNCMAKRILALIAADRAGLVEALKVGKDEIWRLRHASTERPERTLNVIKQMNQALKEVGK